MIVFFNIIADILYIISIMLICKSYLKFREKYEDKYRYIKVLIVTILSSLLISMKEDSTIGLIISLLCIGIVIYTCYWENIKKIIICAIWIPLVVQLFNFILILLFDLKNWILNCDIQLIDHILIELISLGIIYIIGVFVNRISSEGIRNISIKHLVLFTINIFCNFCILGLIALIALDEMEYKNKVMYTIIYVSVTVGVFVELASVILLLVSRNRYKEKELIIKQYLEEQVKQYEYLKQREEETRKFRHDIRGHLYFLNQLRQEEKNQEFEEYFRDIMGKVDDLGNSIDVGNDIVNAVINKAYAEAESKKVKMNAIGHFPSQCNISVYNLCTIFSNLLNNAIEAAEKAEKSEVWIICRYTQKEIIAEIGNYYHTDSKPDKNRLLTTKSEKEYHGWGMKNVEDSVADCKGLLDIEIVDDKFIVSIMLKNKKEDKTE